MHRLTITEFIVTFAILLTLALGTAWALQSWLVAVNVETGARIERAEQDY